MKPFIKKSKKRDEASRVQSKPTTHSEQRSVSKPATTRPTSKQVRIKKIKIEANRRKPDQEAVSVIAASMEKLGQLEPIMIRKGRTSDDGTDTSTPLILVDGLHRIEAAKSLGLTKITAVYFKGDEKAARVYEVTQCLARAGNTVLQRAKFITELVHLVLGKSQAKELERGGRQPGDKGISKTARELGYPRDDIRRCMVIARMSEEAMATAEKLDLDNNENSLLKIAKEDPGEQVALAEQLGRPRKKKQVKFNKKDKKTYDKLMEAWDDATGWQAAFREATENARRGFVGMLKKLLAQLEKGKNVWGEKKNAHDEEWGDPKDEQDGEGDGDEDDEDQEDDEE
jgi:ParB-like chromosome segregation protein Spo0J